MFNKQTNRIVFDIRKAKVRSNCEPTRKANRRIASLKAMIDDDDDDDDVDVMSPACEIKSDKDANLVVIESET